MTERDPHGLADELEQDADHLENRNRELAEETDDVKQDWRRKREDESVPGAVPMPRDDSDEMESPAPQAPPEGAEPSKAEMPSESEAGPPASTDDEEESGDS